ncbi:MAG TPA: hypothetical protein VFM28_07385 [Nitrososphaeraceae archaeon]|nr:hypothetical protein [Nitrososphaeraceae archaeon]
MEDNPRQVFYLVNTNNNRHEMKMIKVISHSGITLLLSSLKLQ